MTPIKELRLAKARLEKVEAIFQEKHRSLAHDRNEYAGRIYEETKAVMAAVERLLAEGEEGSLI